MKMSDEEILAHLLAFRPSYDNLELCALEACRESIVESVYAAAKRLFKMPYTAAWGVMAGWDDLKYPDRGPHWRDKRRNDAENFDRGYAIGQAAYLACEQAE